MEFYFLIDLAFGFGLATVLIMSLIPKKRDTRLEDKIHYTYKRRS